MVRKLGQKFNFWVDYPFWKNIQYIWKIYTQINTLLFPVTLYLYSVLYSHTYSGYKTAITTPTAACAASL